MKGFRNQSILAGAFLLVIGRGVAYADIAIDVTVDTSAITSVSGSEVFFILTGTGGNTATMYGISLGSGAAGPVDPLSLAGSGVAPTNNLTSAISLDTGVDFLNVFAQYFTAGSQLSFTAELTTKVVSPSPDQFSLVILDPNGNPLPNSDPTGSGSLITLNIDYSVTPTLQVNNDPNNPLVTATETMVMVTPEPALMVPLLAGLAGLVAWRRRRPRVH